MELVDRLLDRSVVLSFDRTGFARHRRRFEPRDLEVDLRGRAIAITGANAGLGRAAAEALHDLGADVWLICRDRARGAQAEAALQARGGAGTPRLVVGDVSELASVHRIAAALPDQLDGLVNNAGILPSAWRRTSDGLESTWATNVVGPFLLALLLRPKLERSRDGRVVTVTSGGLYAVGLDVEVALRACEPRPPRRFDGVRQYAHTKRAELVLSDLLAARVPEVRFHAMHPGWADTGGVRSSLPTFRALTRAILRSPHEGADTMVWLAAVAPGRLDPPTGGFWFDRAPAPRHRLRSTRRGDADAERLLAIVRAQARLPPE